jgi:hypothetical protein
MKRGFAMCNYIVISDCNLQRHTKGWISNACSADKYVSSSLMYRFCSLIHTMHTFCSIMHIILANGSVLRFQMTEVIHSLLLSQELLWIVSNDWNNKRYLYSIISRAFVCMCKLCECNARWPRYAARGQRACQHVLITTTSEHFVNKQK